MEKEEFKQVWLPLSSDLYKLAFLLLKSQADAEDALQDLFIKLWSSRATLDGIRNPKGYALILMKHICIDRIRKSGRTSSLEQGNEVPSESTPETDASDKEMLRIMEDVVDGLPPDQQRVVRMHFYEDRDYAEISENTGLTQGNVRVLVSRARDKIREKFKARRK